MNQTAYFIKDRAAALISDAKIHPETYLTAISWLDLAKKWAKANGIKELLADIIAAQVAIFEHATAPKFAA